MAATGVARVAHVADQLPRVDVLVALDQGRVAEVHVRVVDVGAVAVDHEVVAGPALEAGELDGAAARRHQRRAAGGERVLALVPARPAEHGRAGAEAVPAADREDVAQEHERARRARGDRAGPDLARRGPRARLVLRGDPEVVAAVALQTPGGGAVPGDGLRRL